MTTRSTGPLPGVPLHAWERFVLVMATAPRRHVTPRYRLGTFGMDARRLCDVGFMTAPRKVEVGGTAGGAWVGQWREPLTTEKFLQSTPAQYVAFRRSVERMAPKVGEVLRHLEGEFHHSRVQIGHPGLQGGRHAHTVHLIQ